jgi:hypothetical protein
MRIRLTYWRCQIAGWGVYSAIGIVSAAQEIGWGLSAIAGYLLFFLYSIALTDLFRREIKRRDWLADWHGKMSRRQSARLKEVLSL